MNEDQHIVQDQNEWIVQRKGNSQMISTYPVQRETTDVISNYA